jgi:hypothetical protein
MPTIKDSDKKPAVKVGVYRKGTRVLTATNVTQAEALLADKWEFISASKPQASGTAGNVPGGQAGGNKGASGQASGTA